MYRLRLLGSLSLQDTSGAGTSPVVRQRPLAVLALLALARDQGCSRDKLVGYLWPEVEPERARHRLADAVYLIRRSLGEEAVLGVGDTLRLNPEVFEVDVVCFLERVEGNDLEAAVELYRGSFLDGFYVSGSPEFERWVETERQRLADAFAGALEELAERAEGAGDFRRALDGWKRLAGHDPYNSRYVLRLMQALAAAGDRGNALQVAQEHERRLCEELGIEPDAELRALVEGLRNDAGRELQAVGDVALESDSGESQAEPGHGPSLPRELAPGAGLADRVAAAGEGRRVRGRQYVGGLRGLVTRRRAIIGGAAAIGLLGIAVSAYLGMRVMGVGRWGTLIGRGVLEERDLIVLADFEDNSGDSVLALTVTEAMRVRLEQSPVVRVADDAYVGQVLERMEKDPETPLTTDLAREVAIREGLKALVTGQVNAAGSGYVLSSRLAAAETGETLDSFLESAADPDAIIPAIDRLSAGVRERIGESLRTVRNSPPLAQVRTASLEALRLYSMAGEAGRTGEPERSVELCSRAIEIDSTFAAAYRLRARDLLNSLSGDRSQVMADITRAYQLRDRQPLRERYDSEAWYHIAVTGDRKKQIEAYRMALELELRSGTINLLGLAYYFMREYELAEETLRRGVHIRPSNPFLWVNLARTVFDQGRFDEAWETLRQFEANLPEHHRVPFFRAHFSYAQGEYAAAERYFRDWLARAPGSFRRRAVVNDYLASIAQIQGKLAEADRLRREAMGIREEAGSIAGYVGGALDRASVYMQVRAMPDRAVEEIEAALERHPLSKIEPLNRPYLSLAILYADAGRPGQARELIAQFDAVQPVLPPNVEYVGRTEQANDWLRRLTLGRVALAEDRPLEAIEQIQPVTEQHPSPLYGLSSLGEAYEMAGEPDSAIAVYERFVTTPYCTRTGYDQWWLPFTLERLGDMYEQRGDTAKAIYYYSKFADLWKDADPELQPRVEAARRAIEALSPDA